MTLPRRQLVWTKVHTTDASTQSSADGVRKMAASSNAYVHFFRTLLADLPGQAGAATRSGALKAEPVYSAQDGEGGEDGKGGGGRESEHRFRGVLESQVSAN